MAFECRRQSSLAKRSGVEMKPGGRSRDSTLLAGIHRLVVGAVLVVLVALGCDIGRQRNMADGGNRLIERGTGKIEAQGHLARLALLLDDRAKRSK